jgi:hypothetical protein
MVVRVSIGLVVLIVGLAACTAKPVVPGPGARLGVASSATVPWQGRQLREVTSLAALPASVRHALGADMPGSDGIAERGKPFNASDVVIITDGVREDPSRRFIAAGHDGDTWLVAFEQGGIARTATAVEISDGVVRRGWWLSCCMSTLTEVVQQISTALPEQSFGPEAAK